MRSAGNSENVLRAHAATRLCMAAKVRLLRFYQPAGKYHTQNMGRLYLQHRPTFDGIEKLIYADALRARTPGSVSAGLFLSFCRRSLPR
jgi:hypothetical protein